MSNADLYLYLLIAVYPFALVGAWTLGGKFYDWTHPNE